MPTINIYRKNSSDNMRSPCHERSSRERVFILLSGLWNQFQTCCLGVLRRMSMVSDGRDFVYYSPLSLPHTKIPFNISHAFRQCSCYLRINTHTYTHTCIHANARAHTQIHAPKNLVGMLVRLIKERAAKRERNFKSLLIGATYWLQVLSIKFRLPTQTNPWVLATSTIFR